MTYSQKSQSIRPIAVAIVFAIITALIPQPAFAASSQCPADYMCVWSGTGYTGDLWKTKSTGSYRQIGIGTINSYFNNRTKRTFLHAASDGTGTYVCLPAGVKSANLSGWQSHAEAVWLSTAGVC